MHWLDLLAVQGTLKSLFQHPSSKASILWHSAFFYGPILTFMEKGLANHFNILALTSHEQYEKEGVGEAQKLLQNPLR